MFAPDFKHFLKGFDILLFQETWLQDPVSLTLYGYKNYNTPALKKHTKGRGSGGLTICIRADLSIEIEVISHNCCDYVQVLLIKNNQLGLYLCINVYIPPHLAHAQDKGKFWDQLFQMFENLTVLYPKANIILGGDFNARIGPGNMASCVGIHRQISQHVLPGRISRDMIINKPGIKFLELLSSFNLYVLHGTNLDKSRGLFTYISAQRASTIDYIAVTPELIPRVISFAVLESTLSDHSPLEIRVSCNRELFSPSQSIGETEMAAASHRSLKWSEQLQNSFASNINCGEILRCKTALLQQGSDTIGNYDKLVSLLRSFFTQKNPICSVQTYENSWFDRDCKLLKKTLAKWQRIVRKDNATCSVIQLRRVKLQYKSLLREKKQEHAKRYWKDLQQAVKEKKESQFWNLVSLGTKHSHQQLEPQIQGSIWLSHFSEVFGSALPTHSTTPVTQKQIGDQIGDISNLPAWPPVKEDEIRSLILSLKAGKSPGEDLIPPEFLKLS